MHTSKAVQLLCLPVLLLFLQLPASADCLDDSLKTTIEASHREASSQRDVYRHPQQTLKFFDVQPHHTVVEILPGANGWYTEILAPYLKEQGTFYAAQFDPNSPIEYYQRSLNKFTEKMQARPDLYSEVRVTTFNPGSDNEIAPVGKADRVLTFRNVHNWYMRGGGNENVLAAFTSFFNALKPGGVLGVVEHRLPASQPAKAMETSGYMHEMYVIDMALKAGFHLVGRSDINNNPNDSADHPKGVWTLPPSLRLGEEDREKYLAIGESDRMTLKFMKPVH